MSEFRETRNFLSFFLTKQQKKLIEFMMKTLFRCVLILLIILLVVFLLMYI
jgi:hypothetical protein